MCLSQQTTIAQLLYLDAPPMHFARLVADLDAVVERLPGVNASLTWDCDDVAIIQAGSLRVLLAITDAPGTDYAACLTITAGPAMANAPATPLLRRATQICTLIERKLAENTRPDATFWHRTPRIATPDLVDSMIWSLADADLIAWAIPTNGDASPDRLTGAAPMPMVLPPQTPQATSPTWGIFGTDRTRLIVGRNLSLASAALAYGGPQWLAFI